MNIKKSIDGRDENAVYEFEKEVDIKLYSDINFLYIKKIKYNHILNDLYLYDISDKLVGIIHDFSDNKLEYMDKFYKELKIK